LYQNSALSVAAALVAGLGPVVVVRLRRQWSGEPASSAADAAGVDPYRAVTQNVALVLLVAALGVGFFCCGSCLVPFTNWQRTPVPVSVTALEAGQWPGTRRWLEVTDGYLFWPARVTLDKQPGSMAG